MVDIPRVERGAGAGEGGMLRLFSSVDTDGGQSWKICLDNNPMSFEQVTIQQVYLLMWCLNSFRAFLKRVFDDSNR